MSTTLYAICDDQQARFCTERPFKVVGVLENELGRLRNREMMTDHPGMSRAKFGGAAGTHSLTGEKDPHEDSVRAFAKVIGKHLSSQEERGDFSELVVVADPHLTGLIRQYLTPALVDESKWVLKNLSHVEDLHLPEALGLPPTVRENYARLDTRAPGS